ncbi:hypothetical protein OF83DRAFT_1177673 [Amylostereum chailletii]|nr:hypothetical protein OF83DRAFT_1177673 [Amylostereum chailletii]
MSTKPFCCNSCNSPGAGVFYSSQGHSSTPSFNGSQTIHVGPPIFPQSPSYASSLMSSTIGGPITQEWPTPIITHAALVNFRERARTIPSETNTHFGYVDPTYYMHEGVYPMSSRDHFLREQALPSRLTLLAHLRTTSAAYNKWLESNSILNRWLAPAPFLIPGCWFVRGMDSKVKEGCLVEGVGSTGFRYYANVEAFLGQDGLMAMYAGRPLNHPSPITFQPLSIPSSIEWADLEVWERHPESNDLLADLNWALRPGKMSTLPPSSVGLRAKQTVNSNVHFVQQCLTWTEEYAVFVCAERCDKVDECRSLIGDILEAIAAACLQM